MSVIIRDMDMPEVCEQCRFYDTDFDYPTCKVTGKSRGYTFNGFKKKMPNCPLVLIIPVRHGKWMEAYRPSLYGTVYWYRKCSVCDYERDDDNTEKDTPYCPNCGAKMEEEDG